MGENRRNKHSEACIYLTQLLILLLRVPGNSHRNATVKRNANIYCKQMTLKATDNYVNIYLLCFMSLLCVFYSISAKMDDKKSLI